MLSAYMKKRMVSNGKELVDALYLIMLQGINQLLPIFVMPYLMLKLGAAGYGHVGFALSVIQYLIIIVDFGFNLSATKHIAAVGDSIADRSRVFWNVVAAKSILMVLSAILLLLLLLFVPTFRFYGRAIIATFPMLLGSAFTFMWFFQGIGRIRMFSIMNTFSKVALLPFVFVFVKGSGDYVLASFLQAAVFISTAVFSNMYIYHKHLVCGANVTWSGVKDELHSAFPLFLSTASTSVYTQLIVVVLGFCCTADVIGKYSSAERIMRAVCFLAYTPLSQVFFPKISALSASDRNEAVRLFGSVRLLVLAVMFVVCIFLWTCSMWIPYVLGSDYSGLDVYLKIFSVVPLAIGVGGVYGQMGLIALGNDNTSRRFRDVYFVAAVAALCLMCIFVPLWQAVGASIVVMSTEAIVAVLMVYNFKKYLSAC